VLRCALLQVGIRVHGDVVRSTAARPGMPLLYTAQSPPLAELLGPLNKYSNNFMAMQLALVLGAHMFGAPATWPKAHRAITTFMAQQVGVPTASYTLANASGLHSLNRLSAAQLVRLLRHMQRQPALATEFTASLAVAAGSGTLQERMLGARAAHIVRAKTGTLTRASALSGYATAANGVPLAFSILVNDYAHLAAVWAAQDALAEALAALRP
jgi:D-alanyl-D-alanine carboxypeptidase/D-alanyl-D-alanine-endopeptidase (penicillin-binding protein 4)